MKRERASSMKYVRVGDIMPSPTAQRQFSPGRAAYLEANFRLEAMGVPVINHRGDHYYAVDGQHRIHVLKQIGFEDDVILCEVYENLTEKEEAELFLERNDTLTVSAFDKFDKAVKADRDEESTIDRVVRTQELHLSRYRGKGGISAVGVLRNVFRRQGATGLARTLKIIRDAYGVEAMDGPVIDGVSLCLHRYDGQVNDAAMIKALAETPGGLNGLLTPAGKMKASLGQGMSRCIAAAATDIYNTRGKTGKKLPPWWKE